MQNQEKIEALADIQHQIWAHWMTYLFTKCPNEVRFENGKHFETGNKVIPKGLVERWQRQCQTKYSELTDAEKKSDIEQANKFLHLFA